MEIQNGEYIRTKDGYIRKIIGDFSTDNSYFKLDKEKLTKYEFTYFYSNEIFKKEIKNHSFNIIDLIEEGDFVNDKKVKINYKDAILFEDDSDIVEQQIRKIITHEQMEAMEYEVK